MRVFSEQNFAVFHSDLQKCKTKKQAFWCTKICTELCGTNTGCLDDSDVPKLFPRVAGVNSVQKNRKIPDCWQFNAKRDGKPG